MSGCEKGKGVRVKVVSSRMGASHDADLTAHRVGTPEEHIVVQVYRDAQNLLGMEVGDEGVLTFHKIEATRPVVVVPFPDYTIKVCGACGKSADAPRCPHCRVLLSGEISQAEVAALLKREGGGA